MAVAVAVAINRLESLSGKAHNLANERRNWESLNRRVSAQVKQIKVNEV